jgi:hypothetical protein
VYYFLDFLENSSVSSHDDSSALCIGSILKPGHRLGGHKSIFVTCDRHVS